MVDGVIFFARLWTAHEASTTGQATNQDVRLGPQTNGIGTLWMWGSMGWDFCSKQYIEALSDVHTCLVSITALRERS